MPIQRPPSLVSIWVSSSSPKDGYIFSFSLQAITFFNLTELSLRFRETGMLNFGDSFLFSIIYELKLFFFKAIKQKYRIFAVGSLVLYV